MKVVLRHFLDTFESHGFTLDIAHLHLNFEVAVYEAARHCWQYVVLKVVVFRAELRARLGRPRTC